jgi:DNA replication and repair protein RecF
VLVFTSAETGMLLGDPVARRRFLDRGVIHLRPAALESFARYRSLLDQKRALLRAGGTRPEIASWNELLAEAGAAVTAQRHAFVEALSVAFAAAAAASRLPFAQLSISYRPSPPTAPGGADALRAALDEATAREIAAKRPLLGPHRDRIELRWRGFELAQRASAGERKAIGLLLLSAQASVIEAQRGPAVLLVDDADAELDRDSWSALFAMLAVHPQVLLSSNRPEAFGGLATDHRWRLHAGRLEPAND